MSDFFADQDQARRNTSALILLFSIAVLVLVLITNLLVMLTLWGFGAGGAGNLNTLVYQGFDGFLAQFDWNRFGLISLGVGSTVLSAIIYKWAQLAEGGKRVAEALGGQRLQPNSDHPEHQQALNVVEEMAIAAGMPVPPVYLLAEEMGINAFAAGNTPADAVIGLTQGALDRFNRQQLQGVVAHEFSHILNGDMRLNIRLIAVLHGLVFIGSVGGFLLRHGGGRRRRHSSSYSSSSSDKRTPHLMLLGLGLLIVGWIGTFFGKLIKASVSRQREFLADASAVQFTRNPNGIADALKVIGGHQYGADVSNPHSQELSHLFFGRARKSLDGLYATHPPLLDRILKLQPDWDGHWIHPKPSQIAKQQQREQERLQEREHKRQQALQLGVVLTGAEAIEQPQTATESGPISELLLLQSREPLGATAILFGLLVQGSEEQQNRQRKLIAQLPIEGIEALLQRVLAPLGQLTPHQRLPLLERCLPALKCLSKPQYLALKKTLLLVIQADRQTDLFEWCLYQLVSHYLAAEFEPNRKRKLRFTHAKQLAGHFQQVISMLAHQGHEQLEDAERAFNRGVASAGLYNLRLLPEPECTQKGFSQGVNALAEATPALKPKLIKGVENCIKQDKQITPVEREMITAIAAVMGCPLPKAVLAETLAAK